MALPPNVFFHEKNGLLLDLLITEVEESGPLAVDHGKHIFRFAYGVWASDGDSEVRRRVSAILGDRYRMSHAANVLDVIKHREPRFDDESYDTDYLNLPNGLLNWRTGELHSHDPDISSTIRVPIEWDADATCPAIEAWLAEVFPPDAIDFATEVIGYCLLNDNPLHKAILLYGTGRNGKGTYLRLIRALIGDRNISAVTPQSLDDNKFRAAELYGKLANLVGDVDPRIFKATETFKQVTGGDLITAERKYAHPFSFRCRALMIAAFNSLPHTADTSEGFFSRWVVVPFTKYFPAGIADASLIDKLTDSTELKGLLVKAVTGLRRLMARGHFDLPQSVEQATQRFRYVADPVRAFMTERVMTDANGWIPRTDIFGEYVQWSQQQGYPSLPTAQFYERLESASVDVLGHIIEKRKRRGTFGYPGIAKRDEGA